MSGLKLVRSYLGALFIRLFSPKFPTPSYLLSVRPFQKHGLHSSLDPEFPPRPQVVRLLKDF